MQEPKSAYLNRKMLVILLLGFSSGLPFALTRGTLQAWMTQAGVNIKTIGYYALVTQPYALKFIWAPLLDRYSLPFLGRRRGWMLVSQIALAATIASLGLFDPQAHLVIIAWIALLIAFLSASQDIIVDGYRTELLTSTERGIGGAIAVMGYRLAMLTSGALALVLADYLAWSQVYIIMAWCMTLGILGCLLSEEPEREAQPRTLVEAVVHPFLDFFDRRGSLEILAFIILYKLGDILATTLSTNFLLQLHFTLSEIGAVSKTVGLTAAIAGGLLGGGMMMRLGLRRSLFYFGVLQTSGILSFAVLATVGRDLRLMAAAIAIENFCFGLGAAALTALLMSLCSRKFAGTQYALLTSMAALSSSYCAALTGHMVAYFDWPLFFVVCTAAGIPGLLMILFRFDKWQVENKSDAEAK